jgi:hypothetical protein
MESFVFIVVILVGYLAAHIASRWLAQKYNIVSGAEYLLLGILVGPQVSGMISTNTVGGFAPFLTLALGWIGVLVGAQFYLPDLVRISSRAYRIAFVEALFTFAVVGLAVLGIFMLLTGQPPGLLVLPAAVAGAIATAASPTGIALVTRRLGWSGPVVQQLRLNVAVEAFVAITALGILLSMDHAAPAGNIRPLTTTEWVAVSLAIGVVGGTLFHLFLGEEQKIDRLFIGLAGAVILASGAAAYLRLSPLMPAMLIGMILANTSRARDQLQQVLTKVERPLFFVLLIFAGAAWEPSPREWLIPVVVFLIARAAGRIGGAAFAAWANDALPVLGLGWGRALLGQGGLAIAIAISYQLHEGALFGNTIFTAAVVSVLLTDLQGAWSADAVIRSARERTAALVRSTADRDGTRRP